MFGDLCYPVLPNFVEHLQTIWTGDKKAKLVAEKWWSSSHCYCLNHDNFKSCHNCLDYSHMVLYVYLQNLLSFFMIVLLILSFTDWGLLAWDSALPLSSGSSPSDPGASPPLSWSFFQIYFSMPNAMCPDHDDHDEDHDDSHDADHVEDYWLWFWCQSSLLLWVWETCCNSQLWSLLPISAQLCFQKPSSSQDFPAPWECLSKQVLCCKQQTWCVECG